MDEIFSFLEAMGPLSPRVKEHLPNILTRTQLSKKDFLFKAGQINQHFHFIVSGVIRCFKLRPKARQYDEREISKWFFIDGTVIASRQSYDGNYPSPEYYQALEKSVVYSGRFQDLDNMIRQFPEFLWHAFSIASWHAKLWYNVCDLQPALPAMERYEILLNHYPVLIQRIPLKYLASFIGMHETTLSKVRGRQIHGPG